VKAKWLVFIAEYLKDFNGSAAARRAGYKGRPDVIASRLLGDVRIDTEIKRQIAERAMGADEVLQRLADMARGDLGDAITSFPLGRRSISLVDWQKLVDAGKTHLVKKFKTTKDGVEIELHDPQRALELLGKHHRLFIERVEETSTIEHHITGLDAILEKVYGDRDKSGSGSE